MERAYIYMQLPDSDEVVSLGALMVDQGRGSFVYNPAYAAQAGAWVPDAFNYALRRQPYPAIQTNAGIPGFIRDAAPDGWGQIVLNKAERGELSAIQYLLKSPNHDRAGNLMAGTTPKPPRGVGQAGIQRITHLEDFIAWADSVQGEKQPNVYTTPRAAMRLFKEVILPAVGLVLQHTQFLQLLGIDKGALRHHREVDLWIVDDFLNQRQGQLRLFDADVGLGGGGFVGLDDFGVGIPVFAIGGLDASHRQAAHACGAHGIAAIRGSSGALSTEITVAPRLASTHVHPPGDDPRSRTVSPGPGFTPAGARERAARHSHHGVTRYSAMPT